MAEMILPGTYITVRDEGLITAGRVATGNIGIVGTAEKGPVNEVQMIGSFAEAKAIFGEKGNWEQGSSDNLTLIRSLEYIFNNGGTKVYAVRAKTTPASYLVKDEDNEDIVKLTALKHTDATTITIDTSGNEKKVTITYFSTTEEYTVENVGQLVEAINGESELVSAELVDSANGTETPDNIEEADGEFSGWANATSQNYIDALEKLENEIINIVLLAGQDASYADMLVALQGHLTVTAQQDRERIGIIGCSSVTAVDDIKGEVGSIDNDRLIFVAPGIRVSNLETHSGAYAAAALAGLIASLPVQTSPTNKVLSIPGLAVEFNKPQMESLVQERVTVIEKKNGYRVVKGITTATNSAWHQITTRRIVDYAKYGVRSACNPYIGKLNNYRVLGAMRATIDAFLTRMVEDEALVSYELEVSATRAQEIAGEAIVTLVLRPTFSIDFIKVTMYLE
jgi:hypothetical protein